VLNTSNKIKTYTVYTYIIYRLTFCLPIWISDNLNGRSNICVTHMDISGIKISV